MNKMASDIVDRWLITASEEDGDILSADFSEDGDVGVLGARIPDNSKTKKNKGKESNNSYGEDVNEGRYKWTSKKKEECWGYYNKDNPGTRQQELAKKWKTWKKNTKDVQSKYTNFTEYFNDKTKALRKKMLCYHKNKGTPGKHSDLKSVTAKPKKGGKGVENKTYNQQYWKARIKKTANEEMIANIIDRYEP